MFTRRFVLILVALSLLVLLVPACGGDGDDDETTPATSQATTTASAQPTVTQPATTTTSDKPVKIGVINSWTGPVAMSGLFYVDPLIKVVEKQVKDMGGILGGRPVEFVRYDNAGEVAKAAAGAQKLLLQDKVSVLTLGGVSPAEEAAISDVAEQEKILFATYMAISDGLQYSVETAMSRQVIIDDAARLVLEVLTPRPQTIGFMTYNDPESRRLVDGWKQKIEAAGVKTVYEQYIEPGVTDFSPYLTKLKYENPNVFLTSIANAQYMAVAKQMMDLGGWGKIQFVGYGPALDAKKLPGAQGWIVISPWDPSLNDPASLKFKEDYKAVTGKEPDPNHVYIYTCLWAAIRAIELAGTDDPVAVAKAARSGNLEFDTPMGRAHFTTDGHSGLHNLYLKIQDKSPVLFAR